VHLTQKDWIASAQGGGFRRPPRHGEPTGRANARPMTGSAKQSRSHENMRSFCPPGDVHECTEVIYPPSERNLRCNIMASSIDAP
jgi:hypothetical protein